MEKNAQKSTEQQSFIDKILSAFFPQDLQSHADFWSWGGDFPSSTEAGKKAKASAAETPSNIGTQLSH